MTPLVKPLAPLKMLQALVASHSTAPVPPPSLMPLRPTAPPFFRTNTRITQVDSFDASIYSLWERARTAYPVIGVRDYKYLNWRFVERPDAQYQLFVATRNSEPVGYLIVRVRDWFGTSIGYLVDFLVPDAFTGDLPQLLQAATSSLHQQGAAAFVCNVISPRFRPALYRQGFIPWNWGAPIYFHTRVDLSNPDLAVFAQARDWFLTSGDGDQEMAF